MKTDITDAKMTFGERVFVEEFTDDDIRFFCITKDGDDCEVVLSLNEIAALANLARVDASRPVITKQESDAIKVVLPGAKWLSKDAIGDVWAHVTEPQLKGGVNYLESDERPARIPFLEDRFANVPWRESKMEI